MTTNTDGTHKAVVTTVTNRNGETSTAYETFVGTEAEVKASVSALEKSESQAIVETKNEIKETKEEI